MRRMILGFDISTLRENWKGMRRFQEERVSDRWLMLLEMDVRNNSCWVVSPATTIARNSQNSEDGHAYYVGYPWCTPSLQPKKALVTRKS